MGTLHADGGGGRNALVGPLRSRACCAESKLHLLRV